MKKNPEMPESYYKQMQEFMEKGLMTQVIPTELNITDALYLPHQIVAKPENTSTKYRIVFDASSKSSSGLSLNDVLMTGPKIQTDLVPLLIRFRTHTVVSRHSKIL